MRLKLDKGPSFIGLGLDSGEDGAFLEGCLYLAADPDYGPSLAAGPGSASGSLRFLVDPTSLTALHPGAPIALDRSLDSRSAVVGLRAGPLSLFGIALGEGPFAFASREEAAKRGMGATAGGLSLCLGRPDFRVEALAAASYAKAASAASGWQPDPYSSPALVSSDVSLPLAEGALIVEKLGDSGSALAAVSGSYGRLDGPALSFRLDSREMAGPLDLRLRAAAASPAFRALFGTPQQRLASAVAEARLAMRRASSLSASVEAEAAGQGLRYAPRWGEAAALRLVLPLGLGSGRVFEAEAEARRSPEGLGGGSWALAVKRGQAEKGGAASVGATLRWGQTARDLVIRLSTAAAAKGGLPFLGLDLGLELFDGGSSTSPVLAKGGASVAVPWGRSGSLELDADLPEKGIVLEPRLASPGGREGPSAPSLVWSLRYKASFAVSSRRPRSRRSAGPKASSIAQRAAS